MRTLREVLEELVRITDVPDASALPGAILPGLGVILGVTWDDEEGVIVWYGEPGGSTRTFHWESRHRDS